MIHADFRQKTWCRLGPAMSGMTAFLMLVLCDSGDMSNCDGVTDELHCTCRRKTVARILPVCPFASYASILPCLNIPHAMTRGRSTDLNP